MAWSYRSLGIHPEAPRGSPAVPPRAEYRRDAGWHIHDLVFWFVVMIIGGGAAMALSASRLLPPTPTTCIGLEGNLDASQPVGAVRRTTVVVVNRQQRQQPLTVLFRKVALDTWAVAAYFRGGPARVVGQHEIHIGFRPDGAFGGVVRGPARLLIRLPKAAAPDAVELRFGTPGSFNGLTHLPEGIPVPEQQLVTHRLVWSAK